MIGERVIRSLVLGHLLGSPRDMCYQPRADRLQVCVLERGHDGPHDYGERY